MAVRSAVRLDVVHFRRDELATYRLLADEYLSLDAVGIEAARATGAIIEVKCDGPSNTEARRWRRRTRRHSVWRRPA